MCKLNDWVVFGFEYLLLVLAYWIWKTYSGHYLYQWKSYCGDRTILKFLAFLVESVDTIQAKREPERSEIITQLCRCILSKSLKCWANRSVWPVVEKTSELIYSNPNSVSLVLNFDWYRLKKYEKSHSFGTAYLILMIWVPLKSKDPILSQNCVWGPFFKPLYRWQDHSNWFHSWNIENWLYI